MISKVGIRLVLLVAMVGVIACDRVTKHVAATMIAGASSRSFVADTIRLEYAENTGAFLSVGSDWPAPVRTALFIIGNALLLLVLSVMVLRLQTEYTGTVRTRAGRSRRRIQPRRPHRQRQGDRLHERRPRPSPDRHLQRGRRCRYAWSGDCLVRGVSLWQACPRAYAITARRVLRRNSRTASLQDVRFANR
jgi:hypothetical protein